MIKRDHMLRQVKKKEVLNGKEEKKVDFTKG